MSGLRRDKFAVRHHARGEVDGSECFVLVPDRDPAAVAALRAYAHATPDVLLAVELEEWMDRVEGIEGDARVPPDIAHQIAIWTGTLAAEVRNGTMTIETALQRIAGHAADTAQR